MNSDLQRVKCRSQEEEYTALDTKRLLLRCLKLFGQLCPENPESLTDIKVFPEDEAAGSGSVVRHPEHRVLGSP